VPELTSQHKWRIDRISFLVSVFFRNTSVDTIKNDLICAQGDGKKAIDNIIENNYPALHKTIEEIYKVWVRHSKKNSNFLVTIDDCIGVAAECLLNNLAPKIRTDATPGEIITVACLWIEQKVKRHILSDQKRAESYKYIENPNNDDTASPNSNDSYATLSISTLSLSDEIGDDNAETSDEIPENNDGFFIDSKIEKNTEDDFFKDLVIEKQKYIKMSSRFIPTKDEYEDKEIEDIIEIMFAQSNNGESIRQSISGEPPKSTLKDKSDEILKTQKTLSTQHYSLNKDMTFFTMINTTAYKNTTFVISKKNNKKSKIKSKEDSND
jgi:hypothetical protein